ncbi:ribonuclease R [Faecalispora jeddahensis]|uniref:ribonuclease R n=1 Tax=Faecalispora jeddahensis TaxID=1414721 RepID=UPI00145B9BC4|nr:ribonuclease R [Faecalispora jeddahensis]
MIKKIEKTPAEAILKALSKLRHAISSKELLKKSGIKDKSVFYDTLHQMQVRGDVYVNKRHQVFGKAGQTRVTATVYSLSEGFAFVRPENGGDDLYVSSDRLKGAIVGDTVLLKNITETPRGKKAEVASITKRRQWVTTGTVRKSYSGFEIVPDIAIRYNLPIPKSDLMGARPGDKVQAELVRVPRREKLSARVVKIYGTAESAKICADAIIDQNGIPTVFSEAVMAEAARAAQEPITQEELATRLDLREEMICTIDGADAKDLDDAISVRRTERGFDLGVHIADVSHYVREDSAVDEEAFLRGTSVYFADRVIPMLPKELSNGACSLNAGEDKLTFSALIRLDDKGEIVSYRFQKTVIHSKVRGVYSEVNRIFSGEADGALLEKYAPVLESLKTGRELAKILEQRSRDKGAVDFESGESMFTLDENGVCIDVRPRVQGEAEKMIEQLMITANQAAAKLAKEEQLPFVYRIHENPDPERIKALVSLAAALGFSTQRLRSEKPSPADFSELLGQVRGMPAEQVISHQVLRTMEKAKYSTEPVGHFGLALADYCHFTSPIRRYPDLAIHRILSQSQSLGQIELALRFASFAAAAASESSKSEVRAMTAERSAEDCYKAEFMKSHVGEEFDGVVSGVTQRGVFVQLQNSVEGFVPIGAFPNADYRFDGVVTQVDERTGSRITIGTPMRILVAAADIPTGRIDFLPAGQEINSRETV